MRNGWFLVAAALTLGACQNKEDKGEKADAKAAAAGFTPPSVMTRVDFGGIIDRRFRVLDRNGDDRLTRDELPQRNSRMLTLDKNSDGVITQQEWSTGLLTRFDGWDLNRDGSVTSIEREQARAGAKPAQNPVAAIGNTIG